MAVVRITREFNFEMAHSLPGYDGPCRNIHGHSYKLFVTVKGIPVENDNDVKNGMLMDFGDLKALIHQHIISRFDHCTLFSQKAYIMNEEPINLLFKKTEIVPFQPTCENLVIYFAQAIMERLPQGVYLHHLKLYETATSYAEWYLSDNQ